MGIVGGAVLECPLARETVAGCPSMKIGSLRNFHLSVVPFLSPIIL